MHGISIRKGHRLLLAAALFGLVAACDSDLERGVGGAAVGAVGANALGGSPGVGAAVGGAAGVLCDDAGVCN